MSHLWRTLLLIVTVAAAALVAAQPDPYEPDQLMPAFMAYGTAVDRSLEPDPNTTETPDVDHFSMQVKSGEAARVTVSHLGFELPADNIQIVVYRNFLGQRQPVAANNPEVGSLSVGWTEPVNPNGPPLTVDYEVEVYEVVPSATGPNAGYRFSFEQVGVVQEAELGSVNFNADTVQGGRFTVVTIRLTAPAPAGGATLALSYVGPISGPATVTIPEGETSVQIPLNTSRVKKNTTATLTVTYRGRTLSDSIVVTK